MRKKREIKFRAWNKFSEEMIFSDINGWPMFGDCVMNDIDVFEIMQYTGLKDRNGKDIYEGDILRDHGIVAWNDVEHCWSRIDLNWNDRKEWHNLDSLTCPFEVIGNIYENKNLIE